MKPTGEKTYTRPQMSVRALEPASFAGAYGTTICDLHGVSGGPSNLSGSTLGSSSR